MARTLTHKEVLGMCIRQCKAYGWRRMQAFVNRKLSGRPDCVFKSGSVTRAYEVKPEVVTWDEVRKGIGQCAEYLSLGMLPYLVVAESVAKDLQEIMKHHPWLGVVEFVNGDRDSSLRVVQEPKANGPLQETRLKPKLKEPERRSLPKTDVIKRRCEECKSALTVTDNPRVILCNTRNIQLTANRLRLCVAFQPRLDDLDWF